MPQFNQDPDNHSSQPLTPEQSGARAIQAAAQWAQSERPAQFFVSNALWGMRLWHEVYKPEETVLRHSVKLSEGSSSASLANMHAFQDFYIAEASDYLRAQKGPIIVAEVMMPVDEAHCAHNASCAHCDRILRGETAKIIGAKDPTDITLTLDRFRGTASDALVRVADEPSDEVLSVELTDMDLHTLHTHYQEQEVMSVFDKMFPLASYVPLGGIVDLELPQFRMPS